MNEYMQNETQDVNAAAEEPKETMPEGTGPEKKVRGFGIAAMILGILSILLICVQPFGVVLAVAAVVLGILGVVKTQGKGMATSGIVMGGISLVTGVIILIFSEVFSSMPLGLRMNCPERHGERAQMAVYFIFIRMVPLFMWTGKMILQIISIPVRIWYVITRIPESVHRKSRTHMIPIRYMN